MESTEFWEKYKAENVKREHICDYTPQQLQERHKNVLKLIDKYDPIDIGLLIIGKYYNEVWSSRSCSRWASSMLWREDYMDFYCGSSGYYLLKHRPDDDPMMRDFEEADALDQACYKNESDNHGIKR